MEKEQRFQDVVADEILKAFGLDSAPKPSDPGFWQKHCDRYHPEGFKEGSSCKYLDSPSAAKSLESQNAHIANPKEDIESEKGIESLFLEKYNISPFHASEYEDLEYMGLSTDSKVKLRKGTPLSKERYKDALKSIWIVCEGLKKRFPSIQFGFDFIFPFDTSAQGSGGKSSLDKRKGFGYIIIGDEKAIEKVIGREDANIYEWIIRHEIGHSLSTFHVRDKFDKVFSQSFVDKYGEDNLRNFLNEVCNIGDAYFTCMDTQDKEVAKEEIIADIFALYTDTNYRKGMMPNELEDFVEQMIKDPHLPPQNDLLTMDGAGENKKRTTPDFVFGEEEMFGSHKRPENNRKYHALNYREDKWEYFDTKEEFEEFIKRRNAECGKTTIEESRAWAQQELPKVKRYVWEKMGYNKKITKSNRRIQDLVADTFLDEFKKGDK